MRSPCGDERTTWSISTSSKMHRRGRGRRCRRRCRPRPGLGVARRPRRDAGVAAADADADARGRPAPPASASALRLPPRARAASRIGYSATTSPWRMPTSRRGRSWRRCARGRLDDPAQRVRAPTAAGRACSCGQRVVAARDDDDVAVVRAGSFSELREAADALGVALAGDAASSSRSRRTTSRSVQIVCTSFEVALGGGGRHAVHVPA